MVLRNKDGSIYKLRSPNALMKNQNIWDKYVLHNMNWISTNHKDDTEVKKVSTDFVIQDNFLAELEKTKNLAEEQIVKQEPVKQEEQNLNRNISVVKDKSVDDDDGITKTFIYCLPAITIKKKDTLYDEEYNTIEYKNPFSLEGVIIEHHDLFFKFWTNIAIENESVIYPKSNIKRWWRINFKEVKGNGFLYTCIPSDYQPHFEGI